MSEFRNGVSSVTQDDDRERLEWQAEMAVNWLAARVFVDNVDRGFWENSNNDLILPTKIALVMTELAEAIEAHRAGDIADDHLPQHKMFDVEIADAIIRLLDIASYRGVRIGELINEKLAYNRKRGVRHGGKAY